MVTSYEHWLANKTSGWNYESGNITAFDEASGRYAYVGSDITRAYNSTLYDSQGQGGKVSQVTRQVVYLEDADALVVFDRVNSTSAAYKKKWVLHTPNKMLGGTEVVVRGSATDGIMTVDGATIPANTLTMTNGGGKLFLQTLLPASYTVNKVGGPNHRYYVENDGDDGDGYDGTNYSGGASEQPWYDNGDWRVEISPGTASNFDTFLNLLSPRSSVTASVDAGSVLLNNSVVTVMKVGGHVVGFGTTGQIARDFSYGLPGGGTFEHLLVDLVPGGLYSVTGGEGLQYVSAGDAGVLDFADSAGAAHSVAIARLFTPGIPGDADLDTVVDFDDYQTLERNFGTGTTWGQGDFNLDGNVDFSDYQILERNFGQQLLDAAAPEPGGLALLLVGGLVLRRRR
jgi:MYXO-CTERM domain-containing protein